MSGYKMFADRLDYAFKEARTRYTEAYNLMLSKKRYIRPLSGQVLSSFTGPRSGGGA